MHENPFSYSSVVKPINQLFLQAYDDQVSTVRKSAVFCLVAIHTKVGDTIWNYLTKLNYSKVSILHIYCNFSRFRLSCHNLKSYSFFLFYNFPFSNIYIKDINLNLCYVDWDLLTLKLHVPYIYVCFSESTK